MLGVMSILHVLVRYATVAVALALPKSVLDAQSLGRVTTIPDGPLCTTCAISVQHVLTIGTSEGQASFANLPRAVGADGQGRYWILSDGDMPKVFSATGRLLQEVGRRGRGPGEFTSPVRFVRLPGDSVLVIDAALLTGTVVGPNLQVIRSIAVPFELRSTIALEWPRNVWSTGAWLTPDAAGWPLHRLSFADVRAAALSSFGPDGGDLRPSEIEFWPALAGGQSGGVWVADAIRYRITEWTAAGALLRTFNRKPTWFSGNPMILSRHEPPAALVRAISEGRDGLLWVFVSVPGQNWREAWADASVDRRGRGEVAPARFISAYDKLYRTMVEVIDPARERVVARRLVEEWITTTLPDGRAAALSIAQDGTPRVRVLALSIERQ
jgi:hypothetical protein